MLAELQNVTKYYQLSENSVKNIVLNEVSLQINEGEAIAIVSPSGSGKTTLLNILGTLDKPSSGKVLINNIETNTYNDTMFSELRNQQIGFVFQMHHLLPQLTLIENVLLPVLPQKDKTKRKAAEERAMQLIDRVGLTKQIHQRPAQLSGGECQRAAVVRALINQPKLILADEPTGSLDAENANQLAILLIELKKEQNVAMIVATHSQELAGKMDKIYKLAAGRLIVF